MKRMIVIILFIFSTEIYALDVDQKMTFRMLNVSNSKKTTLINRGLEDGLEEGDHAVFYIATGVVARGVLSKVSPRRSVWSLYRISRPNEVVAEKVLNLKISPKTILTDDPSKSLEHERAAMLKRSQRKDSSEIAMLENMDITSSDYKDLTSKSSFEVFGSTYYGMLSHSTETSGSTDTLSGDYSTRQLSFGIELYLAKIFQSLNRISIIGHGQLSSSSGVGLNGNSSTTTVFEYGLGGKFYFSSPMKLFKSIFYVKGMFAVGTGDMTYSVSGADESVGSTISSFVFGGGLRYFFTKGYGIDVGVDYYERTETFAVIGETLSRVVSGPRAVIGVSYRF